MSLKAKWFIHNHYLAIVLCILILTVVLTAVLYAVGADWKFLLAVIGGLLSFVYFIQNQQLEEARLLKELISDFNERYDSLNGELNAIVRLEDKGEEPGETEKDALYDYFNLCSEEYLFYRRGYIYQEVWKAWVAGMKTFFSDKRIWNLWEKERKNGSYYGLEKFAELKERPKNAY